MEHVSCPLCGADDAEPVFIGRDRLLGLRGEFSVVKCRSCGLTYTNPRPTVDELLRHYPPTYGVYSVTGGQARRQRIYHRRTARQLNKQVKGEVRAVLDIGCGDGVFLDEMRMLGWQCMGLEMDDATARRARNQGIDVQTGTVDSAGFQNGRFNLIVMSHVLEHVPDPKATLSRLRAWLKPDGMLYLSLPNIECPERERFGEDWYPWDLPRHLTHFCPSTLNRMLSEAGFRVIAQRFLKGFYRVQSMRYRRGGGGMATGESGRLKETLKTMAFRLVLGVSAFLGRFGPGEVMETLAVIQ